MLNLNKPVQTRDGGKARIIANDRVDTKYPVVALVDKGGHENLILYTSAGCYWSDGVEDALDLVNIPEEPVVTERLFAIYPFSDGATASEFEVSRAADLSRARCTPLIKVTYKDGAYAGAEVLA